MVDLDGRYHWILHGETANMVPMLFACNTKTNNDGWIMESVALKI